VKRLARAPRKRRLGQLGSARLQTGGLLVAADGHVRVSPFTRRLGAHLLAAGGASSCWCRFPSTQRVVDILRGAQRVGEPPSTAMDFVVLCEVRGRAAAAGGAVGDHRVDGAHLRRESPRRPSSCFSARKLTAGWLAGGMVQPPCQAAGAPSRIRRAARSARSAQHARARAQSRCVGAAEPLRRPQRGRCGGAAAQPLPRSGAAVTALRPSAAAVRLRLR